jgi:NIMA (never in mitosis gene a)-related kinase 1/4/5
LLACGHWSLYRHTGTPYYFSPEICQNQPYGTKSDVWALGCLLYELLTLQVPFQAKSLRDLMQKILYSKPAAPNRSAYSADFLQLVVQMLAKAAERRPTVSDIILKPVITAHLEDFKSRYSAMYDDAGQG